VSCSLIRKCGLISIVPFVELYLALMITRILRLSKLSGIAESQDLSQIPEKVLVL
jgi:hypothetical protein